MRTTLDLNDEVFRLAKKQAADDGVPFRDVVESALCFYLGRKTGRPGYQLHWKTEKGRLQPGVDLDDRDSLFNIMEGRKRSHWTPISSCTPTVRRPRFIPV